MGAPLPGVPALLVLGVTLPVEELTAGFEPVVFGTAGNAGPEFPPKAGTVFSSSWPCPALQASQAALPNAKMKLRNRYISFASKSANELLHGRSHFRNWISPIACPCQFATECFPV